MSSVADSVERIRGFQLRFEEGRSPLWESVGRAVVINLVGKLASYRAERNGHNYLLV
ncbi:MULTISPECIES: hypothetical protein [Microcoleus]|uniref:hypothetical protein n=1 Tax=Microcoleus TaxID=44471 RepID=UPI00168868D0|nr:hypothetical protein [Microcoleus sp. FACHB-84]MBD2007994.1 hypothetical protein [Microcoleus sp. FACHB-45]